MAYVTCVKCGVERNGDDAPDCPICRMPEAVDLSEYGGDKNIEKAQKQNEKLIEKNKRRLDVATTDYDSVSSLMESKLALAENIGRLWKQIAVLNNHIDSLKRVKYLIAKEIKEGLKDL